MRSFSIIIVGGREYMQLTDVEVITPDLGIKRLPRLYNFQTFVSSSMVIHDGNILLCGGICNQQECLSFNHGSWKLHSTLNKPRVSASIATTRSATFMFGGGFKEECLNTYEYLPKGSTTWQLGKTKIPTYIAHASAIPVKSDQEIWLIGGAASCKKIISFNIKDHTFQELPSKLIVGRSGQRCAFIPKTNKIIITGGIDHELYEITKQGNELYSTEILDTKDGSITMASPMNFKRAYHGIGLLTIDDEDRLVVFGGSVDDNFVEVFNAKTGKWELTDVALKINKYAFGFLSTKLSLLSNKATR